MTDHGTAIEWTHRPGTKGETWNPTLGCSIASHGCIRCYAAKSAWRKNFNPKTPQYHGLTRRVNGHPVWTGELRLAPEATLLKPLGWREPRTVFVNSMSDLFHENVPDEWIDRVFAIMALCPQHTFIVLTKRAQRMYQYFDETVKQFRSQIQNYISMARGLAPDCERPFNVDFLHLPNVWLGVSAEDQERAEERIPLLLATPAAVRFISAEPLLGPIDLARITRVGDGIKYDALLGLRSFVIGADGDGRAMYDAPEKLARLDWVIVGGESGKDARPMHPAWARSLRDQCAADGVPFFFKQWGEWAPHRIEPGGDLGGDIRAGRVKIVHPTGQSDVEVAIATSGRGTIPGSCYMACIGKRAAGNSLDGEHHLAWPVQP